MSVKTYELRPVINRQKSFYGKAMVTECRYEDLEGAENCVDYYLSSYNEPVVASVVVDNHGNCSFMLGDKWNFSRTTVRHVKDFLYQFTGVEFSTKDLRHAQPDRLVTVKAGY